MADVTPQSWARSLLQALGDPVTDANVKIIVGWEAAEGGNWNNQAKFNPLNTTQPEPGAGNTGSQGNIKAYTSWGQGLQATVTTLKNGLFGGILAMLASGKATPDQGATAIASSPWGTSGAGLAGLISGASTTNGGATISSTGISGITPNTPTTIGQYFNIGDPNNPDEDYWTGINRWAQSAQWYLFSDGEILYVADGYKIMAQVPAAIIDHWVDPVKQTPNPNILHTSVTYDNSAWMYAATHKRRGKIQRKSTLAKVTSPTEITIDWICNIDAIRAGDTVYLQNFGMADGPWLVGNCTRSIFAVYSELTLIPAMIPAPVNPIAQPSTGTPTGTALGTSTLTNPYPTGIPVPMASQYRDPPKQGPIGFGTFQGYKVATWIIPELQYAQAHGWTGRITSAFRVEAGSEHEGNQYPHGAVDFGGPDAPGGPAYMNRENFFKACAGYTGLTLIPEQFPPYSAYPVGDGGHASGTGH